MRAHPLFVVVTLLVIALSPATTRAAPDAGVVGTGTAASCTEAAFDAALAGSGTITFNCGGAATITLATNKTIASDTVIDGGGLITLQGATNVYIQVFVSKTLTLRNITLANFKTSSAGAIENFGTLTLDHARFVNNQVTNAGGAIHNYGTINAADSVFSGNKAGKSGGAIYNDGASAASVNRSTFTGNSITAATGTGGAIAAGGGVFTITASTFTANSALDGGAINVGTAATAVVQSSLIYSNSAGYGGGIESTGTLTVTDSTINRNVAANVGGGIWVLDGRAYIRRTTISNNTAFEGGGLSNYSSVVGGVTLRDVTVSGNTSGGDGGGIYCSGEMFLIDVTLSGNSVTGAGKGGGGLYLPVGGKAVLSWVTVANNNAAFGKGLYGTGGPNASKSLFIYRILLSNNNGSDCDGGNITSSGYNVSGDTSCAALTQTGDVKSANVSLGPLAFNGGATLTHLPLPGNAAIDRVPNGASCNMPDGSSPADQRGASRPVNTLCDSGAVETGAKLPMMQLPIVLR